MLKALIGKTIASLEWLDEITIEGVRYNDDVLRITFTDGTTLVLASWDYESYESGMKVLINGAIY